MLERLKLQVPLQTEEGSEDPLAESRVVTTLKEECESTKGEQTFRFTEEQVKWISYLIDKHVDDFQVPISKILQYGEDLNMAINPFVR